ncbi:MAG: hypothetical protein KDA61_01660, partial [Planctomycetales bacterium]|nr:hypothetical protein [Planctomycetales bacterium]
MRFSIKWLLAVVTYAAVVCASVIYAGKAWAAGLSAVSFSAFVVAAIGVPLRRRRARAFAIGFLIASSLIRVAMFGDLRAAEDVRDNARDWSRQVIHFFPHREQGIRDYVLAHYPDAQVGEYTAKVWRTEHVLVKFSDERPRLPGLFADPLVPQYSVPLSAITPYSSAEDIAAVIRQHLILLFS